MKQNKNFKQQGGRLSLARRDEDSASREQLPRSLRLIARKNSGRQISKRGSAEKQAGTARPKRSTRILFRNILVPVDFSRESTEALKFAVAFARRETANLLLVHVVGPIYYLRDYGLGPVPQRRDNNALVRQSQQRLRSLARRHIGSDVKWRILVCSGTASRQILKVAEEHTVDLITMPTRGLSHAPPAEIGSTAERVVRHALCPVLVLATTTAGGRSLDSP